MSKATKKYSGLERPASIRDVAALAEVSQATVSMVLNNKECISPAARHRVLDAVKKLQYRRRGVGRPSLYETTRPETRGRVVFQLPRIEEAIHSIYAKVLHGAERVLRSHGIDLTVQSFGTPVYSKEVIGLLSVGRSQAHGQLPEVVLMGLPVCDAVDQITYDNREIGILAAQCCLEHKIPRVSFFNFSEPIFEERTELFRMIVQKHGKEIYTPERLSHAVLDDPGEMRRYFEDIFAHVPPPLLFFSPADDSTLLAYPVLLSDEILPGRDIRFISCNNESFRINTLQNRPVVIDIRAEDIGRLGAQQLLHRLSAPDDLPLRIKMIPQLVRESPRERRRPEQNENKNEKAEQRCRTTPTQQ